MVASMYALAGNAGTTPANDIYTHTGPCRVVPPRERPGGYAPKHAADNKGHHPAGPRDHPRPR
jgi:hypothetical protein